MYRSYSSSYEKEDGTRKSEYGRYGRVKLDGAKEYVGFEHVIRYENGIKSDFVLASCSIPINYDYSRLDAETRALIMEGQNVDKDPSSSKDGTAVRFFWDGGLLANTPLMQTVIAHRYYWHRVRKVEDNIPILLSFRGNMRSTTRAESTLEAPCASHHNNPLESI
jgi:hypothetical protein